MKQDCSLCCCCIIWVFLMAVIGGITYGSVSFILGTTQRGGEFSLDSAQIQSINLSRPIKIVMQLNITSHNPNHINGRIQYHSLDFLLFFESFNLAQSLPVEPFKQPSRNTTHFSATLYADSSQQLMPNETLRALKAAMDSGDLRLHLHMKIEGRLSGRWKNCDLKSNDDCYLWLNQIGPNGTGGTLGDKCKWTSRCD